ncbi:MULTISPECIES: urease subunit beta [Kaistia]|uniref:Urease subunit beta n=1 Tax=Kaistia defluvii TaxID=410841 RepID=A0ABV2QZ84_9HYPH
MANKSTPAPASASKPADAAATKPAPTAPGGYVVAPGFIELNPGRPRTTVTVRNTGDRPVQIGSHFHFFEVNRYLEFDRAAAFGQRLDIPANTAVRFEPGDEKDVTLVPYGGKQFVYGFNNLVDGWTGDGPTPDYRPNKKHSIAKAEELGFKSRAQKTKPAK